jgi:lipopolysaccharide export system protein LptA
MRRSEAARYARWSAALALLLAAITVGVYVRHGLAARWQKKNAPPAAAVNVERQSNGLTFSKMEGDRKIFTVDASKSTEFRNQDASLLEEVKITIFGKPGDRHDTIRTNSCKYSKTNGSIECSGTVQIDLQSAKDAELAQKSDGKASIRPAAHVETRDVKFDQATDTARTSERVTFTFPEGSGEAVGVEYNSQLGVMKLLRDVKMTLTQTGGPAGTAGQQVHVTGAGLEFNRDTRLLHLSGPAHAQTPTAQVDAGEFTLNLDEDFRAQKLLATAGPHGAKPHAVTSSSSGALTVNAHVLTAWFDPNGWLKKLDANGDVDGSRKAAAEDDEFTAADISVDMWPEITQPKQIIMDGDASIKTSGKNGQFRVLQTDKARMEFTQGTEQRPGQPKRAETLVPGSIQWTDAREEGSGSAAHTRLNAGKFVLDFADGAASQLVATGNVQAERAIPGSPVQTSTAQRGTAQLQAGGGWSQIELNDNVKFKEGERSGQADRAVAVRATQTMTLTGQAVVRDASTETHAASIIFTQSTGDIRAEGRVRSTAFPGKGATPQFAGVPANITSEKMQGNAKTARAVYNGHARLWQGDSVLESESIELLQKTKQLNAAGNVRAVFPQAAQREIANAPTGNGNKDTKKASLWHVAANSLAYQELESRAHLEGHVTVQSEGQRIRSEVLDLYFTRARTVANAAAASEKLPSAPAGAQQISRAVGDGGVIVEEQGRKATAEHAEYTAAEGKFVMSGGKPTLFDGTQGTTTGRQLTFFLADDTIIVDSENGSRTLTKHRVEK